MGKFTKLRNDAFDGLQIDAGVLLKKFDLENETFNNSDIICTTTGGIEIHATPTYSDFAEDVDNAPKNLKEFKHLDGWDIGISTTSLSTDKESIRLSLGAADIGVESGAITPRRNLKQTDFSDVWWGGDKANGGFVVIRLINALSTEGFTLKTEKNGKGQLTISLTGHVSLADQDTMPLEIYSMDPDEEESEGGGLV